MFLWRHQWERISVQYVQITVSVYHVENNIDQVHCPLCRVSGDHLAAGLSRSLSNDLHKQTLESPCLVRDGVFAGVHGLLLKRLLDHRLDIAAMFYRVTIATNSRSSIWDCVQLTSHHWSWGVCDFFFFCQFLSHFRFLKDFSFPFPVFFPLTFRLANYPHQWQIDNVHEKQRWSAQFHYPSANWEFHQNWFFFRQDHYSHYHAFCWRIPWGQNIQSIFLCSVYSSLSFQIAVITRGLVVSVHYSKDNGHDDCQTILLWFVLSCELLSRFDVNVCPALVLLSIIFIAFGSPAVLCFIDLRINVQTKKKKGFSHLPRVQRTEITSSTVLSCKNTICLACTHAQ